MACVNSVQKYRYLKVYLIEVYLLQVRLVGKGAVGVSV
jgi:hypothetical protein